MTLKFVGQRTARMEGPDKVTGAAMYAADYVLPDMLWGRILRSPYPHARIVRIDTAAARALPGVHAVVTGAQFPCYAGRAIRDHAVLAVDKVRFVGDRVAAVAATTRDIAEQALALIDVEYEELPAVFDVDTATAPGAPAVHEQPKSYAGAFSHPQEPNLPNVCAYMRWEHGELDAGFAAADRVFEHTFHTPTEHHGYLEPHAVLARVAADGRAEVWASNKSPYMLRAQLAACFGVEPTTIKLHNLHIGGDFGGKGSQMEAPVAYLLARESGRPVKLVMSYTEELMAANTRHAARIDIKTGVRNDGTLTAMQVHIKFNGGAYGAYKPLPSLNLHGADQAASCYRVPAIDIHSTVVYTNTLPGGHMRSPGAPQTIFAVEAQFDLMARALGMDPAAFRLKNVLQPGDASPTGAQWPTVRAQQTLEAALRESGYHERRGKEPNVGFGIAMYERGVVGGDSSCKLELAPDGRVTVLLPIGDPGQGTFTAVQQFVGETLNVPPASVQIRLADTDGLPFDFGVGGCRTTYAIGQTVLQAVAALREKLAPMAAEVLGCAVDALAWEGSSAHSDGRSVTLLQLAASAGETVSAQVYQKLGLFPDAPDTNFTAQVAEVAVDPETGQVTVRRITSAHDVGTIVNPEGHQGQIEGGMLMGLGLAVMSEHRMEDGKPVALHLGDYKIPCIADIPELRTVLLERDEGPGPFNCGPIAEAANVPAPAAIANAVADAIGAAVMELPVSAERVYALLQHTRRPRAA
ncbi:xanthine dehydrogenase family protein molybdopterin-binding subunit [Immundisolibacter sp.]|uniref:xanthine dehydrogenase family protein molybdopterin-binding subunit n=1 Tax=Immundisolibacter sp. TaxID=1934948 RepID=UPI00356B5508